MKDTSYKTAITRKKFSKPTKWLICNRALLAETPHHCLDYGCGKGLDADFLEMDAYDPYYRPHGLLLERKYNVIVCNYVINVILCPKEQLAALRHIRSLLNPEGVAYISVRRDIKEDTKTQRVVHLDLLSIHHEKGAFETYLMYA